jgi:hypothetical protein
MGLDQYLYAIILPFDMEKNKKLIEFVNELFDLKDTVDLIYPKCEVGYWRKNYRINNYFIMDEDPCEITIGVEKLEKLLNICKQIQEDFSKLDDLLPLPIGYPGWYENMNEDENKEEINRTIELLTKILSVKAYITFRYEINY